MTSCTSASPRPAGAAFDSIAEQYDDLFTRSLIGRAQRDAVWDVLRQTFRAGQRVLELNCGTGEDALFLSRMGVSVLACDASEKMIAVAARRMANESRGAQVQLELRAIEQLDGLTDGGTFDGVFSDFSGLNCVSDLSAVGRQLSTLVKPGGWAVLCLSGRFCLWESLWYLAVGEPKRAIRRWKGSASAYLGNIALEMRYPTVKDMQRYFAPYFRLCRCKGIGIFVPPSYVEHLARKHPAAVGRLAAFDRVLASWPGFRSLGDHVLLVLERSKP